MFWYAYLDCISKMLLLRGVHFGNNFLPYLCSIWSFQGFPFGASPIHDRHLRKAFCPLLSLLPSKFHYLGFQNQIELKLEYRISEYWTLSLWKDWTEIRGQQDIRTLADVSVTNVAFITGTRIISWRVFTLSVDVTVVFTRTLVNIWTWEITNCIKEDK